MNRLLILAAVASIGACHSRNEDQAGAAPATGDTGAVTEVIDSTRTGPPGVAGRPSGSEYTRDSVPTDTSLVQTDTTTGMEPSSSSDSTMTRSTEPSPSPSSTPQDTLGPASPDAGGTVDSTTNPNASGAGSGSTSSDSSTSR